MAQHHSCSRPLARQLMERAVWLHSRPCWATSGIGGTVQLLQPLQQRSQRRRRRGHLGLCAAARDPADGPCHYQTLGVPHTATKADVKKAFRRLARQWHPDVNPSPIATDRFKAISRAFEVLSDEQQRQRYDHVRFGGSSSSRGGQAESGASAGAGTQGGGSAPAEHLPADLQAVLHLDFREAALGAHRTITLEVLDTCPHCSGSGAQPGSHAPLCRMCRGRREIVKRQAAGGPSSSTAAGGGAMVVCCPACGGRGFDVAHPCSCCGGIGLARQPRAVLVRVPAGVDEGSTVRLVGEGDLSRVGGPRGAILLELEVGQEEGMWRQGLDLHSQLAVPLWDALLGGTATVSTLRGDASLTIPPGTQHGAVLSLQHAGVRPEQDGQEGSGSSGSSRRRRCGSHHFEVQVQLPREVSSAEQQLLLRLAEVQRQRQKREQHRGG